MYVANVRPAMFDLLPYRLLVPLVYNLRPAGIRRKIVEWTPDPNVQRLKNIIDIQDEQVSSYQSNGQVLRLTDSCLILRHKRS